jgi:hypothetical protein
MSVHERAEGGGGEPDARGTSDLVHSWDRYIEHDPDAFAADYAAAARFARDGDLDALLDSLRGYASREAASAVEQLAARLGAE